MASTLKVDTIQTNDGTGTIALQNQLSGMAVASLPTGSVLQVVNVGINADASTTTTSYVDSGISATITPTATSSKILMVTSFIVGGSSGASGYYLAKRNNSSIIWTSGRQWMNGDASVSPFTILLLDSPSTTSATTYNFWYKSGGGTLYYHTYGSSSNGNIILMEIAG
jgi:hypothetical protein